MDYAFVPGIGDPAFGALTTILGRRPQTVVTFVPKTSTLATFLAVLDDGIHNHGFPQAGDLILGAHGSLGGFLFMGMDSNTPSPVNYEVVENLSTIKIPAGVGTANTRVMLSSCMLGADDDIPFLKVLKKAFGSLQALTAPRFLHSLVTSNGKDFWEFMKYDFFIKGEKFGKPLADRAAVIAKFGSANLKDFNGGNIPAGKWGEWVPAEFFIDLEPALKDETQFTFPLKLVFAGSVKVTLDTVGVFRTIHERAVMPLLKSVVFPVGDDVKAEMLEQLLTNDPLYQASHPYPNYVRYDYKSLKEFTEGWHWEVTRVGSDQLRYIGTRYTYELEIPITKPSTDEWIYNLYPESGTPIINFSESNQPYRLFAAV